MARGVRRNKLPKEQSKRAKPPQPRTDESDKPRWHSAPWWTGIAGIAGVLATVIAIGAWWFPRGGTDSNAPVVATSSPNLSMQPGGPIIVSSLRQEILNDDGSTGPLLFPAGDSPQTRQAVSDLNNESPSEAWFAKYNVLSVASVTWEIAVEAVGDQQVDIVNIYPILEGGHCSQALTGAYLERLGGGGETDKITLYVQVDSQLPTMQWFNVDRQIEEPFFVGSNAHEISLKKGEINVVRIAASVGSGAIAVGGPGAVPGMHCKWSLRFEYLLGGKRGSEIVNGPGGKPFELAGWIANRSKYPTVFLDRLRCSDWSGYPHVSGEDYAQIPDGHWCGPLPSN